MKNQLKLFTNVTKPFVLLVLLLTVGVGNVWANYAYLDLSGFTSWYNDGDNGGGKSSFTVSISTDHCDREEISGTGVWRFNIGEESGTAYFKRRPEQACNGKWNEATGTVNATQNVMRITGWDAGTMQTSYVINYIHNTNQIYFDNTNSNFSGNIYFVIGHDVNPNGTANTYSIAYPMDRVVGTNLYRAVISATWQDANFYGVIASTSDESTVNGDHNWGSSSLSSKGTSGYTAAYEYVFNMEGGVYLCSTSASENNQALTFSYCGTEHTSLPKHNASQAAKKRDTGTTYTDVSGSWPATLKLRGSYMKTSSDTARSTITSTASTDGDGNKTYSAIQSGLITQSYTGLDASYHFEGWGTGSAPTNTEATNEYHIPGATTVYAFFSKLYTLTYDRKGDYSTSTLSVYSVDNFSGSTSSGSSIPTGHLITLVATPATGYEVEGWYSDADCTSAYTSGSDGVTIEGENTFKLASLNANTEVYCKFRPKNYTIPLVNMEATTSGTTSVDVTYNASTHMTDSDPIAKPTKNGYTFGGYWVRNEDTKALVKKLIDENGKWIADVEGYTSHDGSGNPTWVHDYPISLYAKWTETPYTITPSVSPAGAGSVNTVTDAHLVTPSSDITATPTNAVWVFDHWTCGTNVGIAGGKGTGDNPVTVTASQNSTITAYFKHRYNLLGSKYEEGKGKAEMATGGMPGWTYGSGADFTINSYTADGDNATVDLSYTCTLEAGTYIFEIHDRQKGESLGRTGDGGGVYALTDGSSVQLRGGTDKDQSIFFYPQHAGQYTFRITYMTKDGNYYYPTVTIERPHQMHMGHKRVDIDGTSHSDDTGGTLTASTGGNSLANGDWYNYGANITYTASAQSGYTLTWYTNSDYSSAFSPQPEASWPHNNVTGDENVYAKFTEKTTTVSLENDGHGKVQIGGVDKTGTTCGVTTTRSLTAVPNDGYAFKDWSKPSGDDITLSSTTTNPTTLTGVGAGLNEGQRVYASFSEIARTITASAGTGGTVSAASYTAYIDTKADISATPATGYKFKEWQETGGTSNVTFYDVHSASTKIKATGDATIQAVFEPRWAIAGSWKTYPESTAWDADTYMLGNIGTNGSSKDTCYVEITLLANTDLTFKIVDRGAEGTVAVGSYVDYGNNTTATQYMKYNNHTNWGFGLKSSGYYDCGITTTGGGTYKFAFNITDKSLTVTYQTSYQSNFGWKYADGAGTLHDGDNGGTITVTATDGGSHTISSGDWVAAGASITYLASPAVGYAFGGWHNNSDCSTGKFNDNLSWTDGPLAATSNSYAKFVPVAVTFTNNDGSGDGKWSTASNWSPACVPTIDHDVVITKPVTVDIAHATAKSIVLDQNSHTGKLTIQANKGLEVAGTITRTTDGSDRLATRPEDLILESSSAGNASLIFNNSNSCQATVQMYSIGDIEDDTWNWQFMGTPFTSANALYSYYGSYLYEWKAGGHWDAVANGGTMTPFIGYCITQDEPTYYVMDGTLNPTTSKILTVPAGVEMVFANSWSAPIDIGTFTDDAFGIDTKTVYLFNTGYTPDDPAEEGTGAGTYIAVPIHASPYTGNYLIAPMQGFYVDNTSGSAGSITMDYATVVRPTRDRNIVAGAMHAPKRAVAAENEPAVMKIKATGSRYSERIVILEREDFSTGFDNGWDGKNLNEPGVAPILYALREDGTKDAVSAIPTYEGTVVGFRIGEDNNYTFSFNYDGEDIWYLNDLKEEKSTLIDAANTYSFVAEAGDAEARFIISATPIQKLPTGIGNDANDAMVKVRKLIINDQLFIIRAGRMYNAVGSIVK